MSCLLRLATRFGVPKLVERVESDHGVVRAKKSASALRACSLLMPARRSSSSGWRVQ